MRNYFDKLVSDTWSSWTFRAGSFVLFVRLLRKLGGSTLTMTTRQWSFGVFSASTATASSDPAGTRPR
jgi:hypothetical protein